MKFVLKPLTKLGSRVVLSKEGIQILKYISLSVFVCVSMFACSGYSSSSSSTSGHSNEASAASSELVKAALAQIADSQANKSTDTQCSNFLAAVLRRTGLNVPAFHANDFDKVAAKAIPDWSMTEFSTADLEQGRNDLRLYLNSMPDHTAFIAQWPRDNQSGHVAIVEKISTNNFAIYQAQGGLALPHTKATKVEGLLYGHLGIERSKIRLWTE